jgi:phytoene dehydrogenase-like protein
MSGRWDAIVIGAGADGLVASAALARAGLKVILLERAEAAGGVRRPLEFAPGFRASLLGPDPGWVPPSLARGLGLAGIERVPLDAPLTVVPEPGRSLTLWNDAVRAAAAIRKASDHDAAAWPGFLSRMNRLAALLETLYQAPAPDIDTTSWKDLPPLLFFARKLRSLGRAEMPEFFRTLPMSVWELLDDTFQNVTLKAAVAAGGVQEIRQGPRSGGTAFVLLHHLAGSAAGSIRGRGRWRVGPDAFLRAAEEASRRGGVTIRTGAVVERITIKDDAVTGVVLQGGEEIPASRVISTADPATTLLRLVDPVWIDPEILLAVRNIKFRGCAATVFFALDGLPGIPGLEGTEPLSGIVTLTPSLEALERAADAAKYGQVSERPHVEITVPTIHAPGLAPAGRHVLVARAQYAPYRLRDGATWDGARRDALAESVTAAIAGVAPGFASQVLHRAALTPRDIEDRFGLTEGAVTQGEITLDQILFMRPIPGWSRHAMPVAGLYLGGAGTHPGPGIPGGAGWLAARRAIEDRRRA